ncbi:putative MFS multidrug transporter [Xylariaceae sp. FL1019]|nr:putative MFS multidrug transporter [Xylariaceae sp. FL1019]
MTTGPEPRSNLSAGQRSSPPTSIREDTERHELHVPEGTTGIISIAPETGNINSQKAVPTHDGAQEQILGMVAPKPAPDAPIPSSNFSTNAERGKADHEYIRGYKLYVALFGIVSVFFLVLLDFSITATAIPYITSDFHRLQDIGWYGSAYVLSSAALQPLTGKLYTYLNVKHTFLFFFLIFEVGSLLCGVATSSTFFILGRTVAGVGSSGLENGALTLIAGAVPLHKRPFYNGIVFGVCQTGIVLGPLIGGALTQYASWRWCFYINLPIGALSSVLLFFTHIPDITTKPPFSLDLVRSIVPKLDLIGFALFAPTTVMFLLALQWGSTERGWSSPTVIGLFAGSGVVLIFFILWERRVGDMSLIPFYLVKRRVVWASTIQDASLFVNNYVGVNYVPIYFQAVKGVGPSLSGVYTLPSIVTQLLCLVVTGALVTRLGYYLPFAVLVGAATSIACGLITTWNPATSTANWIGDQILYGLRGMGLQMSIIAVQNAVLPAEAPLAIAFMVFVENLVASIFTIVGNVIFTHTLTKRASVLAPSVSPEAALAAGGGAEAVRALLPPGSPELDGLLLAFSDSVNAVFYLLAALGALSSAAAWGMGWKDIRKKAPAEIGA